MPINIFTTIDDPSTNFDTEAEGISGSDSNGVFLWDETSQQTFLTTPHA